MIVHFIKPSFIREADIATLMSLLYAWGSPALSLSIMIFGDQGNDKHAENSEVSLLSWLVAVAVMNWPLGNATGKGTTKLTLPLPSVVSSEKPKKISPSP